MRIGVVSLFPELIHTALGVGVVGRALARGLWRLRTFNPRDHASPPHFSVDDRPYGGGPGMVMRHAPLAASIEEAKAWNHDAEKSGERCVVFLSPQGAIFDQSTARRWSNAAALTFVCGRYEGIDERTVEAYATDVCSIGDFVLSGGEFAALSIIDSIVRLLPGALGDAQSAQQDSFSFGLLDHPHYTRPPEIPGVGDVPDVLLSGDHGAIARWHREQSLTRTFKLRPDLLQKTTLSPDDVAFLMRIGYNTRS